jgi:ribonuclease HII
MNKYGLKFYNDSCNIEVGLDECARGCLFGRTYASAVIWNPEFLDSIAEDPEYSLVHSIRDSKKMSASKRKEVSEFIKENCLDYSIQWADEKEIDKINILKAVQRCFHTCLDSLNIVPDKIFVDGTYFKKYGYTPYECVEKGDNYYLNIASASILAKVAHDEYIAELCGENPDLVDKYDISNNMGYGTKKHLDGISKFGITQFHRRTFGPCKGLVVGAGAPVRIGGVGGGGIEMCDDDGVVLDESL